MVDVKSATSFVVSDHIFSSDIKVDRTADISIEPSIQCRQKPPLSLNNAQNAMDIHQVPTFLARYITTNLLTSTLVSKRLL